MTREQAIKLLRKDTSISEIHKLRDNGLSHTEVTDAIQEAMDLGADAIEKQVGKKTIKQSTDEKTHYKCVCGYIHMTVYKKDGFRLGRITKYCECCGQKVDESEVE